MFITRAGTYARSSLWRSANIRRSADSTAPGVVSSSRQTSSMALQPPPAVGGDQRAGRLRAGGPRGVGVQGLVVGGPRLQDRVDDRPLRDHLVVAGEERGL